MWHGSDGHSTLVPKDDEHGVMISAFVSRTWGFRTNGNPILPEQLHEINQLRLHPLHNTYISTEAALNVNGHTAKGPIEDCGAFCRLFEYGANNDGYWNYNTMALQLEDFIDCVLVLVPDPDFVILFDQSAGHGKKQADGLCAMNMNVDWGGAVSTMRDTEIGHPNCLGPYNHDDKLQVGDIQYLTYRENDCGPVARKGHCLNDAQCLHYKDSQSGAARPRRLTKRELVGKLQDDAGIAAITLQTKNMLELSDLCRRNGIELAVEQPVITEDWMGTAKGLFQVLWERGWIDPDNMHKYVRKPRSTWLEADGKTVKEEFLAEYQRYSLVHLMSECPDFKEEKSAMENLAADLLGRHNCNIEILVSTKYHCEMAGEGIEYGWGYAKKVFRSIPLQQKRTKDDFWKGVEESLRKTSVDIMHRMSAKACRYMLTYRLFDEYGDDANFENEGLSYAQIEKYVLKLMKCHRSSADQDTGFISRIWREAQNLEQHD